MQDICAFRAVTMKVASSETQLLCLSRKSIYSLARDYPHFAEKIRVWCKLQAMNQGCYYHGAMHHRMHDSRMAQVCEACACCGTFCEYFNQSGEIHQLSKNELIGRMFEKDPLYKRGAKAGCCRSVRHTHAYKAHANLSGRVVDRIESRCKLLRP